MSGLGEEKPLRKIAVAFEPLADVANSGGAAMELGRFSHACAHMSVAIGSLGSAFEFLEKDFVSKVDDLIEASRSISTLKNMIELDIEQDCVRQDGSHTRNLLRVLRGLNMFRVLYEEIIKSDGNSVRDAAEVAYEKVFAPHHSWGVRRAVESGKDTLPTKSQLLKSLNEDEGSAKVEMQSFVRIIGPVIQYVEELFNSMQLGIDW